MSRRRARPEIATTLSVAAATAAVAAAAVYFLDPSSGKRRRAQMRDRVVSASREGCDLAAKLGRGTYKRATGMYRRSKRHLHAVADQAPF
ncbi:MAG TPA: hypothetical protein VJQ52_24080 [Steroidobacteraceae bacterium]|nr:hypothetical protein [Steroidobacteraceae bacterium]